MDTGKEHKSDKKAKSVFFAGCKAKSGEDLRSKALYNGFTIVEELEEAQELDYLIRGKQAGKRQIEAAVSMNASIVTPEDFSILLENSSPDNTGSVARENCVAYSEAPKEKAAQTVPLSPLYIDFVCNKCAAEYRTTDENRMSTFYCGCGEVISTGNQPASINIQRTIVSPQASYRNYCIKKGLKASLAASVVFLLVFIGIHIYSYMTVIDLEKYPYAVNSSSKIFHCSDCAALKTSTSIIYFEAEDFEKLKKEYKPCKICKPMQKVQKNE